jgi:hypothetical protein
MVHLGLREGQSSPAKTAAVTLQGLDPLDGQLKRWNCGQLLWASLAGSLCRTMLSDRPRAHIDHAAAFTPADQVMRSSALCGV